MIGGMKECVLISSCLLCIRLISLASASIPMHLDHYLHPSLYTRPNTVSAQENLIALCGTN